MPRRVLVVEDDVDIASLLVAVLEMEGFTARAVTGTRTIDFARSFRPDIVLLDLMMPELDGFEVARLLQQDPATGGTKILVMTAMQRAEEHAGNLGAAGYIVKPFSLGELVQAIEDVLR